MSTVEDRWGGRGLRGEDGTAPLRSSGTLITRTHTLRLWSLQTRLTECPENDARPRVLGSAKGYGIALPPGCRAKSPRAGGDGSAWVAAGGVGWISPCDSRVFECVPRSSCSKSFFRSQTNTQGGGGNAGGDGPASRGSSVGRATSGPRRGIPAGRTRGGRGPRCDAAPQV